MGACIDAQPRISSCRESDSRLAPKASDVVSPTRYRDSTNRVGRSARSFRLALPRKKTGPKLRSAVVERGRAGRVFFIKPFHNRRHGSAMGTALRRKVEVND